MHCYLVTDDYHKYGLKESRVEQRSGEQGSLLSDYIYSRVDVVLRSFQRASLSDV